MVSYLTDTNSLEAYNGSSWAAVGGAASTTKIIFFPPTSFTPPTSAGAGTAIVDGTNLSYAVLDFQKTSDESADTTFIMPSTYDAGNITVDVWWTTTGGSAAETVAWEINTSPLTSGEVWDSALTDVGTATGTLSASDDLETATMTWSSSLPAADDVVRFRLSRDTGADDLDADARLLGVAMSFTCTEAS
jgi:hypothetical protein